MKMRLLNCLRLSSSQVNTALPGNILGQRKPAVTCLFMWCRCRTTLTLNASSTHTLFGWLAGETSINIHIGPHPHMGQTKRKMKICKNANCLQEQLMNHLQEMHRYWLAKNSDIHINNFSKYEGIEKIDKSNYSSY
jgi:hypothetical protein